MFWVIDIVTSCGHAFHALYHVVPVFMSQENHPKPFKVLWEQLLGEDVSHLQGCFAENEENKALFHGLPHKMIVLGNVLSPFFICFSFRKLVGGARAP